MRLSVVVAGAVSICLALFAISFGSPLWVFVDVITVFLVLSLPVAFLIQAHGGAGLATTLRAVRCWLGPANTPPEQLEDARCVVDTGAKATYKGALVCVMIGAIQILQHTRTDNLDTLGPAMAVMLMSYFYAHCINFVFWGPLGRWLAQHAQAAAVDVQD